jgi:hypothetical protein
MTTGRQLIVAALREPMQAIGWTPRASGWFTRPVTARCTGVVAVSTAAEHAPAGTADATLHVHLRREDVESVVTALFEGLPSDGGYRSTTATTSIGALLPGAGWRTWRIARETVASTATELATAVRDHADPWLAELSAQPGSLLAAVRLSPATGSALGPSRSAVLLTLEGRPEEASSVLAEACRGLGDRTDPAADQLRRTAERLQHWISGPLDAAGIRQLRR